MIFSLESYTILHTLISLIGIASGFVVLYGLLTAQRLDRWTQVFLITTVLTSVTGYGFPFEHLLPSHIIGAISLVVLTVTILARYTYRMTGAWRWIYVVGATIALYLNTFVLVFQTFLKVPFFKALAPTQSEPPFAIAQGIVLLLFIVLGVLAVRRFRPMPLRTF
jgi:hypothetical protein